MFDLYRTQNAWQMLHTEGKQLLNEKGDKVRLLGVNCAPLVWTSYSREIMDMITYACDEWKAPARGCTSVRPSRLASSSFLLKLRLWGIAL